MKISLKELDELIDAQIPSNLLTTIGLDLAVQNVLTINDIHGVVELPRYLQLQNESDLAIRVAQLELQDAHKFCLDWIYKYCRRNLKRQSTASCYKDLVEVYEFAREYKDAWTIMPALFKELLKVTEMSEGEFKVEYSSDRELQHRITDTTLTDKVYLTTEGETVVKDLVVSSEQRKIQHLMHSTFEKGQIDTVFPRNEFEKLVQRYLDSMAEVAELDESWSLGSYSIAEIKKIWAVVKARALLQLRISLPLFLVARQQSALDKIVLKQSRDEWVRELSQYSGLSAQRTRRIFADLTYRGIKDHWASPWCCPFFQISNNIVLLNNSYAYNSDPEDDAWFALAKRDNNLHGELSSKKEAFWIEALKKWLCPLNFQIVGPLNYVHGGKQGDMDLLILSKAERFGLVCELKWLTRPQGIAKEFEYRKMLEKGREQAQRAKLWVETCPKVLEDRSGISAPELVEFEYAPLVLSKTLLDSSESHVNDVPVANEFLLRTILDSPINWSLRRAWKILKDRSYLLKEGVHFRRVEWTTRIGNIRFFGDTAVAPLRDFDAGLDFN